MVRVSAGCRPLSAVGIDVAKATLSVCLRDPEGSERALSFRNTEADVKEKILPLLKNFSGKVVMESTGHYHWNSALLLREAGKDVRVVNPILAKQYTSANIRKVKTDPADAAGLARMALVCDHLPPPFVSDRKQLHLRKKLSVIATTEHQLQALTGALRSLEESRLILQEEPSKAEEDMAQSVRALRKSIRALEREFERDAAEDPVQKEQANRLRTIPGVSAFTAHVALEWFEGGEGRDASSWIAYAGLDISVRESGTWKGTCRLTKRGNNFLRRRLYSAAWGAMMHDERWRAYYDHLREQGRPHVEALLVIARKIIRTMFLLLKEQTVYESAKAFPQPAI